MRVDPDGIFLIDKKLGICPSNEMRSMSQEEFQSLKEGDRNHFVVKPESEEGPLLSIDKARGEEGWPELKNTKKKIRL